LHFQVIESVTTSEFNLERYQKLLRRIEGVNRSWGFLQKYARAYWGECRIKVQIFVSELRPFSAQKHGFFKIISFFNPAQQWRPGLLDAIPAVNAETAGCGFQKIFLQRFLQ
jgi:hypothetical protein